MIYLTAGESHGPQLTGIIEGLPAGLHIDVDAINDNLAKRQGTAAATASRLNMTRFRSSAE